MTEAENYLTQQFKDYVKSKGVSDSKEFTLTETLQNRSFTVTMKGYSEGEVKSIIKEVLNYE